MQYISIVSTNHTEINPTKPYVINIYVDTLHVNYKLEFSQNTTYTLKASDKRFTSTFESGLNEWILMWHSKRRWLGFHSFLHWSEIRFPTHLSFANYFFDASLAVEIYIFLCKSSAHTVTKLSNYRFEVSCVI